MYIGDHIVFSAGLAISASRRFSLPLVPIVSILIFMNIVDYDHLYNFRLDDGTADSLVLYPFHRMSGVLIFILAALALICPRYLKWFFCFILGLSGHMFCDQIANIFAYDPKALLIIGTIQVIIFIYLVMNFVTSGSRLGFISFIVSVWVLSIFEIVFKVYGLQMSPQGEILFWVLPPSIALLTSVLFFWIFSKRLLDARIQKK